MIRKTLVFFTMILALALSFAITGSAQTYSSALTADTSALMIVPAGGIVSDTLDLLAFQHDTRIEFWVMFDKVGGTAADQASVGYLITGAPSDYIRPAAVDTNLAVFAAANWVIADTASFEPVDSTWYHGMLVNSSLGLTQPIILEKGGYGRSSPRGLKFVVRVAGAENDSVRVYIKPFMESLR